MYLGMLFCVVDPHNGFRAIALSVHAIDLPDCQKVFAKAQSGENCQKIGLGPMVDNHWKPLKPMVAWPQHHGKKPLISMISPEHYIHWKSWQHWPSHLKFGTTIENRLKAMVHQEKPPIDHCRCQVGGDKEHLKVPKKKNIFPFCINTEKLSYLRRQLCDRVKGNCHW